MSHSAMQRQDVPPPVQTIYLDHATLGPLPRRTLDAVVASMTAHAERGSLANPDLYGEIEEARRRLGAFVGAPPERLAYTPSTSAGISLVARGLAWRAGDEVVVPAIDFPSLVLPWMLLQRDGVVVKRVPCFQGRVEIGDLLDACTARTRVVAASWVQFTSGYRLDLVELGEACRRRGILFVVDVMQGAGALELNLSNLPIDAAAAQSYKWLLAPQGVGWLYLGGRLLDRLSPSALGFRSLTPRESYLDHRLCLRPEAARFESGVPNLHGIVGLKASLELLGAVGSSVIEDRVMALAERLRSGLAAAGCALLGDQRDAARRSGIVAFRHPRLDPASCRARLLDAGIVTGVREGCVRVAAHYYNGEREIDRVVALMRG